MEQYSVIIPAYNEERYLPKTLVALKKAMSKIKAKGEILVVDNNSSDNTCNVAKKYGAKVIFEPVNQISRARNRGALEAKGSVFIFLDADTIISYELLENALKLIETEKCIGGGSRVKFDTKISGLVRSVLFIWNHISSLMKYPAGCFIFCSRESFFEIGGFNQNIFASEEIWFARKLKRLGRSGKMRVAVLKDNLAVTSARKFNWFPMWKLILTIIFFLFMPVTIRIKNFCSIWYTRPSF